MTQDEIRDEKARHLLSFHELESEYRTLDEHLSKVSRKLADAYQNPGHITVDAAGDLRCMGETLPANDAVRDGFRRRQELIEKLTAERDWLRGVGVGVDLP